MSLGESPLVRLLLVLLVLIAGLHLAQQLWSLAASFGDVIFLFFLAWLVGFVLSPLARALRRDSHTPPVAAVVLVYLGMVLTLALIGVLLVPALVEQLTQASASVPAYVEQLPGLVDSLQRALDERHIGIQLSSVYSVSDISARVQGLVEVSLQNALGLATGVASLLFNIIIVLVLSFYFVIEGDRIAEGALRLVPERYHDEARALMQSVDRSFGGFLRGQLIQAVIYAGGTAAIMLIAGLNYVLLASIFVAVAIIIPFIGPFLGLAPPLLIGAFQLSLPSFILLFISLLVLQQVIFNIVAPKVMSQAMGMHPLLVFFALLVGIKVAGIAGAIFGIPVAAVINAMVPVLYRRSQSLAGQLPESNLTGQPTGSESAPPADVLARAFKALEQRLKHE